MKEGLSDAAKEARRAYQREWYRRNKEKAKQRQRRYWERKAAAAGDGLETIDGYSQTRKAEGDPIRI